MSRVKSQAQRAVLGDASQFLNHNLFITGRAGSGHSTLMSDLAVRAFRAGHVRLFIDLYAQDAEPLLARVVMHLEKIIKVSFLRPRRSVQPLTIFIANYPPLPKSKPALDWLVEKIAMTGHFAGVHIVLDIKPYAIGLPNRSLEHFARVHLTRGSVESPEMRLTFDEHEDELVQIAEDHSNDYSAVAILDGHCTLINLGVPA